MKQKELNLSDILENNKANQENPSASQVNEEQHLSEMVDKVSNSPEQAEAGEKKGPMSLLSDKDSKSKESAKDKAKKAGLSKKQMIYIGGGVLGAMLIAGAYMIISAFSSQPVSPSELINLSNPYLKSPTMVTSLQSFEISMPEPTEPKTHESPINGVLLTEEEYNDLMARLPVAVMVNNHQAARPQSNLSKADIVFETIAESGITRYMPIFWSNTVDKVGPIRSARQYYIEWLSPFDALYIHDGYASSDDPRVNAGGNIVAYGIHDIATYGAWREYDGVRFAPHNEYSSPVTAWERAETLGWTDFPDTFDAWEFKRDAISADRGNVVRADIVFWERIWNGGAYDVAWSYDSTTNSYLRSVGGSPDIDQETDLQIAAKVVILQSVTMTSTYDEKAHVIIDTIGSGDAVILQDGIKINAKWKKTSRTERTQYTDSDGNPIEFNRGLIWVEAVPEDQGSFDIIEK